MTINMDTDEMIDQCLRDFYSEDEKFAELGILLGFLRGLYMLHQSHHWQSTGKVFYGDHLLFQRLYEGIAPEIDDLAERAVGSSGDSSLTNYFKQIEHMKRFLKSVNSRSPVVKDSLNAEVLFLALGREVMRRLENKGILSPGLEQLIGNILDKHETHVYLLRQRASS